MARPRLVHEGLPIGLSQTNNNHDNDDDRMTDAPSRPRNHTTTNKPGSSLLNALGGAVLPAKSGKKAHNSRFVIGADRQMKSVVAAVDDHARRDSASSASRAHHSNNSYLQSNSTNHPTQYFIGENHYMMPTDASSLHHAVDSHQNQHTFHQHQQQVQRFSQQQDTYLAYPSQQPQYTHTNPQINTTHHAQPQTTRTRIQIGRDERHTESMEGVEDHSIKPPLVVLDGANVAHAYGKTLHSRLSSTEVQPDARGILVACEYFARAQLRVLVVLPAHWFQRKSNSSSSLSDEPFLRKVIEELDYQGVLVPSPPSDDDDAYALTIAQRENVRAAQSHRHGPGYVLSNDMFRDAQNRDATGEMKTWLNKGMSSSHAQTSSLAAAASQDMGPGRISYTFCDMGRMDDNGERELDFIPNPRHPLIAWIESQRLTTL